MTEILALAGFGFVLGMRHATDADHVIAVTTILSQQEVRAQHADRRAVGAGPLDHGAGGRDLIIAFNVVIPPPVGLAMEFAVAVMLIVLGILN